MVGPAFLRRALAAGPVTVAEAGPYGALQPFDANGIALPPGFTSREIARGGQVVPTAGAAAPVPVALRHRRPGDVPDARRRRRARRRLDPRRQLRDPGDGRGVRGRVRARTATSSARTGSSPARPSNCAGGPTPWGTWLSCEEYDAGPRLGVRPRGHAARRRASCPPLGVFAHEAVCVDPVREQLYLTEDEGDGCWYRFTPTSYPDLSDGLLEAAIVDGAGNVTWAEVPEPGGGANNPTRDQVEGAARFDGGEGTWYDDGRVYFTTKGDSRVWLYDVAASKLEVLYDRGRRSATPRRSAASTTSRSRRPATSTSARTARDHDICLITPDFTISRFLKLDPVMHSGAPDGEPGRRQRDRRRRLQPRRHAHVLRRPAQLRRGRARRRAASSTRSPARSAPRRASSRRPRAATGPAAAAKRSRRAASDAASSRRREPERRPGGTTAAEVGAAARRGDSADRVAPGVQLGLRRRIARSRLLRFGLPLTVELDEPAGVLARLDVRSRGRWVPIARAAPTVAVRGRVALRLEAAESVRAACAAATSGARDRRRHRRPRQPHRRPPRGDDRGVASRSWESANDTTRASSRGPTFRPATRRRPRPSTGPSTAGTSTR